MCLSYRHEHLSFISQNSQERKKEKPDRVAQASNCRAGEAEIGESLVLANEPA